MSASQDSGNNDRLVSLRACFEEAVGKMTRDAEWRGAYLTVAAESARHRLDEMIEADFGPKYDGNFIEPMQKWTEMELQLWFATNSHRLTLFERVNKWINLARAIGAKRLLIDGSYITRKHQPDDVDCVILLPADFQDQLVRRVPEAIELLVSLQTRQPKELLFAELEPDWWGWVEFFGRTRETNGRRKGLIEVAL